MSDHDFLAETMALLHTSQPPGRLKLKASDSFEEKPDLHEV